MSRFQMDPSAMAHFQRISERVRANVVEDIADDAERLVPVDTGELRNSIHTEGNQIVADAEHAIYVELGTRHMDAQPYLAPALYRKRNLRGEGI